MKTKTPRANPRSFPELPRYKVILPADDPVTPDGIPIMFEDEGQEEMGDTDFHTRTIEILKYGFKAFLADRPGFEVYSNLNLYYLKDPATAYISPDVMIVQPARPLGPMLRSYRMGKHGPRPVFMAEVLSKRSGQQSDFDKKPLICAKIGTPEYMLIDVTETYLDEGVILNVFQRGGSWQRVQDPDLGVTSALGFRVVIEADGWPRVINAATGERYYRPGEAEARVRELEAEVRRLRQPRRNGGR
jgi:Uma2 family endonuclease